VHVNAPQGQVATRTAAAVRVLQTTPGITGVRVLTDEEQRALLEPWLGADLPLDRLPVPRLIEITVDEDLYDATGLALRLEGEVPGARLDDHARWRAPLIAAAARVRALGIGAVLLIGGAMAAMITLAARAALASNAQVIEVLRLIGARDVYVARAFVRRVTLRAAGGALAGSAAGTLAVALLPPATEGTGLLAEFGFRGAEWLWPFALPLVAGIIAFLASRTAALSALKRIP
jgi:cell division transport system permease protein